MAHILLDRASDAVEWARFAVRQPESHINAYMILAIASAEIGAEEGTSMARERLLQLKPDFTPDFVTRCWPLKNQRDQERLVQALVMAAL
jgi:hypothetical protein